MPASASYLLLLFHLQHGVPGTEQLPLQAGRAPLQLPPLRLPDLAGAPVSLRPPPRLPRLRLLRLQQLRSLQLTLLQAGLVGGGVRSTCYNNGKRTRRIDCAL